MSTVYWRGIAKAVEEMGELSTVLGKLMAYPKGDHPDMYPHVDGREKGAPPLRDRLKDEFADVLAILDYIGEREFTDEELAYIGVRIKFKAERYKRWILAGVQEEDPKGFPPYTTRRCSQTDHVNATHASLSEP